MYVLQFVESQKYVSYAPGRRNRQGRSLSPFKRVDSESQATRFASIDKALEAMEQRGRHWGTKHGNGTRTSKARFALLLK